MFPSELTYGRCACKRGGGGVPALQQHQKEIISTWLWCQCIIGSLNKCVWRRGGICCSQSRLERVCTCRRRLGFILCLHTHTYTHMNTHIRTRLRTISHSGRYTMALRVSRGLVTWSSVPCVTCLPLEEPGQLSVHGVAVESVCVYMCACVHACVCGERGLETVVTGSC